MSGEVNPDNNGDDDGGVDRANGDGAGPEVPAAGPPVAGPPDPPPNPHNPDNDGEDDDDDDGVDRVNGDGVGPEGPAAGPPVAGPPDPPPNPHNPDNDGDDDDDDGVDRANGDGAGPEGPAAGPPVAGAAADPPPALLNADNDGDDDDDDGMDRANGDGVGPGVPAAGPPVAGAAADPPPAPLNADNDGDDDDDGNGVDRADGDGHLLARNYDPDQYQPPAGMQLGRMDTVCGHCGALRWQNEPKGACCHQGKVKLDFHPPPPDELVELMTPGTPYYDEFRGKIRAYNTAFQMASMGCDVVRHAGAPHAAFTVQGNVCHRIGTLLPVRDGEERFLQLYFLDAEQATERRATLCGGLDRVVLNILSGMLHVHNNYVRALQPALLMARGVPNSRIVLSADHRPRSEHERRFNLPMGREVAVLMPDEIRGPRDIVVHERGGQLFRINEFSRQYDPLCYVLLHPHGTDGWSIELKTARGVTMRQYAAFHIRYRPGHFNLIPRGGRLFQQYLVDTQVKVESDRLAYVREHQDGFNGFRAETIRGVRDALADGEEVGRAVGRRVVLPASVTGSPRYMMSKLQDALCYVRDFGSADFFITVTCNPAWPEIVETLQALYPGEGPDGHDRACDHPDIVSQVFDQKLQVLLKQLRDGILGRQRAIMYTIEWQKRGLPHAHILLWVVPADKPRANDVDACVCAEVPDPQTDPHLHAIVCAKMVHGPCGALNPRSACMKDGRCSVGYPKQYQAVTEVPERTYPKYRRRAPEQGGRRGQTPGRRGVEIDNRWIVPYNPHILRSMDSHVNVEVITHAMGAIRYCIKYVTKGTDMIMFAVQPDGVIDEVAQYQQSRFLGSMEAAWRLQDRPIHGHHPPVQQLQLHMDNDERRVVFRDDANLDAVLDGEQINHSMLTSFFELCQVDEFAATLLYTEVPRYYTWQVRRGRGADARPAHWRRRLRGQPHPDVPGVFVSDTLSRMYTTTPRAGEVFFLRLLLNNVRGPRSYEHLRTVNGRVCATMREACSELGLLEDGLHWARALDEASVTRFPGGLRFLFALILIEGEETCNPAELWMRFRDVLSEDIARRRDVARAAGRRALTDDEVYDEALRKLAVILRRLRGKTLAEYGLPVPPVLDVPAEPDDEPDGGAQFDPVVLAERVEREEVGLTDDQRAVYDEVLRRLDNGESGVIFLQAPGGCGKTYLENLLLAKVRSRGEVAVAVAASGIAASLLEGGTTAHYRFKIPVLLHNDNDNVCGIDRRSPQADYLRRCRLIVWDEAGMMNRRATEAVDRALQDVRDSRELFGGILTLMSGDWRQILPVVRNGGRPQVVDACLKSSPLWPRIDRMELATNMRARNGDDQAGEFATFLLRVGDGRLPVVTEPDTVQVPEQVVSPAGSLPELVDRIFPNMDENYVDQEWLHERTILAPLNAIVDSANTAALALLPGETMTYYSVDTLTEIDNEAEVGPIVPPEVLNAIDVSGMPSHRLQVKVGAPVVLMRNLNAPRVVNGTLCTVLRAAPNVLELRIASGIARGELLFLPRLPLLVSAVDSGIGRPFRRLQFPVKLSFAMTINRCQGQTKRRVGIYLPAPVFTHGQLYVALSRVGSFAAVEVLAPRNLQTRNVVYREVL
ncbi:uncharacterized protein LOC122384558 [Amphibalanus amphitrite]|uniref:uncharacterized protein LOC122384558 n=1 Tax=Amphibalanus amphitrite TaxID=1232801 RepID=UPI001C9126DD|nr:uncharacterized protein LOC122384558 [Amphibalanus amphitrite]